MSHDKEVLALALIGSAAGAVNHDLGSRLQSLIMALDELELLAETNPELAGVAVALRESTDSAVELLTTNRALVRGKRERTTIADVLARASRRAGVRIAVTGTAGDTEGPIEGLVQAIALLIELASTSDPIRVVPVTFTADTILLPCAATGGAKLLVATSAIGAAGGRVDQVGASLTIALPR